MSVNKWQECRGRSYADLQSRKQWRCNWSGKISLSLWYKESRSALRCSLFNANHLYYTHKISRKESVALSAQQELKFHSEPFTWPIQQSENSNSRTDEKQKLSVVPGYCRGNVVLLSDIVNNIQLLEFLCFWISTIVEVLFGSIVVVLLFLEFFYLWSSTVPIPSIYH